MRKEFNSTELDIQLIIDKLENKDIEYSTDWLKISCEYILTDDQIWAYKDYLIWNCYLYNNKMNESLIERLLNYFGCYHIDFDLSTILLYCKLSETFLRKYIDKYSDGNWTIISSCQKLSKNFIKEFKDKLDWIEIYKRQTLTEEFIEEIGHKTYWDVITSYQPYLSEEFIEKHSNEINFNWKNIKRYQKNVSKEFLDKHHIDIMTAKSLKGGYKKKRN